MAFELPARERGTSPSTRLCHLPLIPSFKWPGPHGLLRAPSPDAPSPAPGATAASVKPDSPLSACRSGPSSSQPDWRPQDDSDQHCTCTTSPSSSGADHVSARIMMPLCKCVLARPRRTTHSTAGETPGTVGRRSAPQVHGWNVTRGPGPQWTGKPVDPTSACILTTPARTPRRQSQPGGVPPARIQEIRT